MLVRLVVLCVVLLLGVWLNPVSGCGHVCSDPKKGPVLGGVDFVELKNIYLAGKPFDSLPVLGLDKFGANFEGYQFLFRSQANREAFLAAPEDYYPQFGGYCAWGLTGYDIHVDDPSGFCLAGGCVNSTNGFSFLSSQNSIQSFWYLKLEAKHDMEKTKGGADSNIAAARKNFDTILKENSRNYCFNTDMVRTCK